MSTGADCSFYETKKGWYYEYQQWPYGENPDYDKHGPFRSQDAAINHMDRNYPNPGGWTSSPLKDSA